MRQTAGPAIATTANDFRIIPLEANCLVVSPSANHADGIEKNIDNKYGKADKNPFWKNMNKL